MEISMHLALHTNLVNFLQTDVINMYARFQLPTSSQHFNAFHHCCLLHRVIIVADE